MSRFERLFGTQGDDREAKSAMVQWGVAGGNFIPAGATRTRLPAGAYKAIDNPMQPFRLEPRELYTDGLIDLHESVSHLVVARIQTFWASKEKLYALRQLHKRGILFVGAPGTGKTSVVMLLALTLIKEDGIILLADSPQVFAKALKLIREIEPSRPIICIIEDIDHFVDDENEEQGLLSLLDGENQVDNVVHLATTNFPENLDDRILGRPSRFDEIVRLGLPDTELRRSYVRACVPTLPDDLVETWVSDTQDMNFGHLRELVVATQALGCEYEETIERLRKIKPVSGLVAESANECATLSLTGGTSASLQVQHRKTLHFAVNGNSTA